MNKHCITDCLRYHFTCMDLTMYFYNALLSSNLYTIHHLTRTYLKLRNTVAFILGAHFVCTYTYLAIQFHIIMPPPP